MVNEITSNNTRHIHFLETVVNNWGLPQKLVLQIGIVAAIERMDNGLRCANHVIPIRVFGHLQVTNI